MKKIAIWGLGTAFEEYYPLLESRYEICALVDNDKKKWGQKYKGRECQSPEVLKTLSVDKIIIIAIANKHIQDIKQQLAGMRLSAESVSINELFSVIGYENVTEPLSFSDELDNRLIVENDSVIHQLRIYFQGEKNTIRIGRSVKIDGEMTCICRGKECQLVIGDNSTLGSVKAEIAEGGQIIVGKDCMFADGINLMQMAYHPIYDLKSGKRINIPKNIVIGEHVWIGRNVTLLAGFEIEKGSIVGTGSISSSKYGPNCTIAGNPASVIHEGVTWGRPAVGYGVFDNI